MSVTPASWNVRIDPTGLLAGRTELNINSGPIQIDHGGIDWGDGAITAFLADRKYGSVATGFRIPNRMVHIPLMLGADFSGTEETVRARLQAKVALLQREGGVLLRQRAGGLNLYADIVNATLTLPDVWGETGLVEPNVVLVLECLPDFYGDEVTLDAMAGTGLVNGPLLQNGVPAIIPGDHPARARLILSDQSGQVQESCLWGLRSKHYDQSGLANLFYPAEGMTPLEGSAATAVIGAQAGRVMMNSALPAGTWCPVLSTDIFSAPPSGLTATPSSSGGTIAGPATRNYLVTALTPAGETAASNEITASVPSGSTGSVALSWAAASGPITGYRVYQAPLLGAEIIGPTLVTTLGPTVTSFTDTTANQYMSEFPVPGAPILSNVCIGPDGNVWGSLEGGTNFIAKCTMAGVVTLYALSVSGSFGGINAGPDGNIWITNFTNSKVLKVATTGVVLNTYTPGSTGLGGICAGADGNMWVLASSSNQVFKMSTTGTVVGIYTCPVSSSFPHGLNLGWDNNVWICGNAVGVIYKVTPSGGFTTYTLPISTCKPYVINKGPDGNMWFTEQDATGNNLGRMTTSGVLAEFPCPTAGASLGGICPGPDGNVYFCEKTLTGGGTGNKIGRVILNIPGTSGGAVATVLQKVSNSGAGGTCTLTTNVVGTGNLLIAVATSSNSSNTLVGPTGFTQIGAQLNFTTGAVAMFYKQNTTGAEGNSFNIHNGAAGGVGFMFYEVAGAVLTGVVDTSATSTTASGTTLTTGSVTPSTSASFIVSALAVGGANVNFTNTWTNGLTQDSTIGNHYDWASGFFSTTSPFTSTEGWSAARAAVTFTAVFKMTAVNTSNLYGRIEEYTTPTSASNPDKIVAGPDGNIWFSESGTGKFARFNISPGAPVTVAAGTGSAALTHQGSYRVWARAYSATDTPQVRLVWGVADVAHPIPNDPVLLPGVGAFYMLDLGEIRIDAPPVGASVWHGVVQALAANNNDTIGIDCIYFQPLDESSGVVSATQEVSPAILNLGTITQGVLAPPVNLTRTAIAGTLTGTYYYAVTALYPGGGESPNCLEQSIVLAGQGVSLQWQVPNSGGPANWSPTGFNIYRATTGPGLAVSPALVASLAGFYTPGQLVPGQSVGYNDSGGAVSAGAVSQLQSPFIAGADIGWQQPERVTAQDSYIATVPYATTPGQAGLMFATNFGLNIPSATIDSITVYIIRRVITPDPTAIVLDAQVSLVKAGVVQAANRASASPWPSGVSNGVYGGDLWGTTWTPADINSQSFGVAMSGYMPNSQSGTQFGVDAVYVQVFYHFGTGFNVAQDAVIYASQVAELRSDGMFRQGSGVSSYGPIAVVEGDLPRLPSSGIENRPVELLARASRGDLQMLADGGLDTMSVTVKYRPCYLFRP